MAKLLGQSSGTAWAGGTGEHKHNHNTQNIFTKPFIACQALPLLENIIHIFTACGSLSNASLGDTWDSTEPIVACFYLQGLY